jgi:exodeoxyribonuclease V beta subunit
MHVALPDPWRIASFSSLTRTRHALGEEIEDQRERIDGDIDDVDQDAVNDTGAYLHAFPRGVQTGLFFHDVLEHLDFTQTDSDQTTRLIESMLADYGFPSTWLQPVRAMLINLVAKELPGEKSRFSLCAVALSSSLKEVEFYFPLKRITPVDFNVLFANIGIHSGKSPHEGFSRLEFSPIHGFMKGFMDCIIEHDGRYYLIDWKSNYLGGTFEDYEMASIEKAMTKHNYTLQYHIYLAALNKYLSLRVPNYCYQGHFGGVIYIFLRGISADPVSSAGIFFNKPPEALIAQLGELLMDK